MYKYKEAEYFTTYVDGVPHTRWENKTTVRDANGNIIKTYYFNDDSDEAAGGSTFQGHTSTGKEIISGQDNKENIIHGGAST
ncbi:hypothetical protein JTB14_005079 [Gonioctena quinquepunctata]|nr:hypothetical protein JTB14_005079 [Gonioctena quinquepunctata]